MKYLFIGEDRSKLAIKMNVRWEDGKLAAKQLFDALDHCEIDKEQCKFLNLFEPLRQQGILMKTHSLWITALMVADFKVVAMGNKVSKELDNMGISHIKIVHPAARGKIRGKQTYFNHIKEQLC